jgi:hypothetical protein
MAHTKHKHEVIDYPPSALREFRAYGYEWIDSLHFIQRPEEFLPLPDEQLDLYLAVARERFKEAGWHGDGDIGLLWLPPFVFPLGLRIRPEGIVVWHVKQAEDGVSWLLSPIELPFEEFRS